MRIGKSPRAPGRAIVRHLGITVPDLRRAEDYYRECFAMDVLFRESLVGDDGWHTLSDGFGWDEALDRSLTIGMVALSVPGLVLALFQADRALTPLTVVGISDAEAEPASRGLELVDPFGITWQFTGDPQFRSNGEISNRWLRL